MRPPRADARAFGLPIRLRLALWYGGLAGGLIVLICLFIYAVHARAHYDDVDRSLITAAQHVAGRVAAGAGPAELEAMLATPLAPNVSLRIAGPAGDVIAEAPSAALAPPADPGAVLNGASPPAFDRLAGLAPPLAGRGPDNGAFGLAMGADGGRWRVYVTPVDGAGRVEAITPLDWLDRSVEALRRLIGLLAVAGAAVAVGGGWLMAARALRPVAALTETAGQIAGSQSFERRVPVGAGRDELGRLAATFNQMLDSLERAYRTQQRFVADASHELRAPLTAIQGNLELLERQPDVPIPERQEAVGEASREARRLAHLVADLLALARADAGVPLRRQRVELDRVLLEAVAEARHLARGQRLGIEALEPVHVVGDPDRLQQLLLILLDNAIKYTPPERNVQVALRRAPAEAVLVVKDTGVGIPSEDLPRVFERFHRADPARARDPGGTGLGLPIARSIAEQHGGRIELASTIGLGTTATVRLPLEPVAAAGSGGAADTGA